MGALFYMENAGAGSVAFVPPLRSAGASPRPTNLSQIRHRQYGVSVNDVGADAHIGSHFYLPTF